jgi:hypothetical protein
MKRNLWNELAKRARLASPAPVEMPFRFEEDVLGAVRQSARQPWNPLSVWLPVLRPALGVAFAISIACLFLNNKSAAKPTTDFVSETESLIQMAVLNE